MEAPIVIIGVGELGTVFAQGFLRCGHPVYPFVRGMDINREYHDIPTPELVLVAVQENKLYPVLAQLPEPWRHRVGLMQNELLPNDWLQHGLIDPTVAVVWFEKKPGMALTNILYTPIYGPQTALLDSALKAIGITVKPLTSENELLFELVRKSVYILTVNISGLITGGTVCELWSKHQRVAEEVAREVITIQEWLTGKSLSAEKLIAGMVEGIEDCPNRNCLGRSALARLQRALAYAEEAAIITPRLTEIYNAARPG